VWDRTAPVGSFPPNLWGLHDMLGNVSEWVEDCWNEDYSGAPSDGSAWQQGDCSERVQHGATYMAIFHRGSATGVGMTSTASGPTGSARRKN